MGIVYKVHHKQWDIDMAVKSPKPEILTEKGWDGFIKEAETWVNLGLHPNTVSCYYVRLLGGVPRIFAEYVDGGSLEEWIQNGKLYEGSKEEILKRILDISIQFAWGLQFAHEQGLVHRDVKPANVLISNDGIVKVTDFGIAKARIKVGERYQSSDGKSIMVSSGGMTPAYCSPEQAEKKSLNRKTDIWSWAVSVLEMFTGGVHWTSGVIVEGVLKEYFKNYNSDENIPKIPEKLYNLLMQCYSYNQEDRPKDFIVISNFIMDLYSEIFTKAYPLKIPKSVNLLADSLNNKALSYLDIGNTDKAFEIFDEALKINSLHIESEFNRGLKLWRLGIIDDIKLLRKLKDIKLSSKEEWKQNYLIGQVQLERNETKEAIIEFKQAIKKSHGLYGKIELEKANVKFNKSIKLLKEFEGHDGCITSVQFSPDGRYILSGSIDCTVKLWDIYSGKCLMTYYGHSESVYSVSFSPDGKNFISGSKDKTIKLWDISSPECIYTFVGHIDIIWSVNFSPDGKYIISGSKDKTIMLWNVITKLCEKTFTGHIDSVESVCFSPDGKNIISGSEDYTIKFWDLHEGKCQKTFYEHSESVHSVCFSPDGKYFLSGSADKTMKLWDITKESSLKTYKCHTDFVWSIDFSPNGKFALSGSEDNSVKLWNLETGKCIRTFIIDIDWIPSVNFSKDGKYIIFEAEDSVIYLWKFVLNDYKSNYILSFPKNSKLTEFLSQKYQKNISKAYESLERNDIIHSYKYLNKAINFADNYHDQNISKLYSKISEKCVKKSLKSYVIKRIKIRKTGGTFPISLSFDDKLLLFGNTDQTINVWNIHKSIYELIINTDKRPNPLCFSNDGKYALSCYENDIIKLYNLKSGVCKNIKKENFHHINSMSFSPDNILTLLGYDDNSIELWNLKECRLLKKYSDHTNTINSVCFSPDGKYFISGSEDKTIKLWDVSKENCIKDFIGQEATVRYVNYFPNGKHLLSNSIRDIIKIWDINSGECVNTISGYELFRKCNCISPDGKFILMRSKNGELHIIDAISGNCIYNLLGHIDSKETACFSHDGNNIFVGGWDKIIINCRLIWELGIHELIDWDEGARPYLEIFLELHRPYSNDGFTRDGKPIWNDNDFKQLLDELKIRGYGWLRPEGVRKELETMTKNWEKGDNHTIWDKVKKLFNF